MYTLLVLRERNKMNALQSMQQHLAKTLDTELNQLGANQPGTLNLGHGEIRISCAVRSFEQLACELDGIRFEIPRLTSCPPETLAGLSEQLCDQLSYLLEPITPIEFDAQRSESQNRSNPPACDGQRTRRYYELLVRPGEIVLARYEKPGGLPRQSISMMLTREVLLRLLADVVQVVA